MKISVVIPAYNTEKYIQRAVNSALNQTFKPFEIIVVDDGSSDQTAQTARACSKDVIVISQPNGGVSNAKNNGIARARGDWIAFLDSDDEWLSYHLEQARNILSAHPFLNWYFGLDIIRSQDTGRILYFKPLKESVRDDLLIQGAYFDNCFEIEARHPIMTTVSAIVKKSVLLSLGGFNESLGSGEDRELWLRIGLSHPRVGFGARLSGIYWIRGNSITNTASADRSSMKDALKFLFHLDRVSGSKGPLAKKTAEPFILDCARRTIARAVKFNDLNAVNDIFKRYGYKLGFWHNLLAFFGRFIPPSLMPAVKKLKDAVKPR